MVWAAAGQVGARPGGRPPDLDRRGGIGAAGVCNEARIPVTAAGGRSGVVGGAVPVHGGVVLDLCGCRASSRSTRSRWSSRCSPARSATAFEAELRRRPRRHVGHWPQSMALSTVGGWLACRGAGQLSNRYGKIEDIVVGLEVVLADGRVIRTGGQPRQAVGPDLNQLFVGSEGTLGVITRAWLQAHPAPAHRAAAYGFAVVRRRARRHAPDPQRGASPAVLRLYDEVEADPQPQTGDGRPRAARPRRGRRHDGRRRHGGGGRGVRVRPAARRRPGRPLDGAAQRRGRARGADLRGYVVDTMEVAGPWSALPGAFETVIGRDQAVPGTLAASAHQSHSYRRGLPLLHVRRQVEPDAARRVLRRRLGRGTRALAAGGALSHHHGVGLNRARFVAEALGPAFDVLVAIKAALDPNGILNPGKLGLPDPFGPVEWPDRPG